MSSEKKFIYEVEPAKPVQDGKPSVGPVYRSIFAKDGFPEPPPGMDTCWDIFRLAVETYPNNPMLGHREIVDGKAGEYAWLTYKEVYDIVIKLGNAIRHCGVGKVDFLLVSEFASLVSAWGVSLLETISLWVLYP
uniref:Long-chain-fatty-acid--CoA ligase n=1 Tax=Opuntia streptacantha TaxID=393608 RepID=A0A7C8YYX3_OPUST